MDDQVSLELAKALQQATERIASAGQSAQQAAGAASQAAVSATRVAEAVERPTAVQAGPASSGAASLAQSILESRAQQQRRKDLASIPTAILQGVAEGRITDGPILASIQELAGSQDKAEPVEEDAVPLRSTTVMERIQDVFNRKGASYARGWSTGRTAQTAGRMLSDLYAAYRGPPPVATGGQDGEEGAEGGGLFARLAMAAGVGTAARWGTYGAMQIARYSQVGQAVGSLGRFGVGNDNAGVVGGMTESVQSGISNVIGGASMGGMLGGPTGALIGGIAGASLEIAKLPERINEWSKSLVESKRGIAQWNGALTQYFAEAEWRQYRRDIESGKETGESVSRLGRSWQNLQDTLQPAKDKTTNWLSNMMTAFTRDIDEKATLLFDPNRGYKSLGDVTWSRRSTDAMQEMKGLYDTVGRVGSVTIEQRQQMLKLWQTLAMDPAARPEELRHAEKQIDAITKALKDLNASVPKAGTNVQEWANRWRARPMKSHYVPRRR